jgi:ribosomal protein L40E
MSAGNYTIRASGTDINEVQSWFRIDTPDSTPWWIIIVIILIVVAVIVGITLYLYFVGLGKTVQCGDCGAFIPEGAAKCPKCGVEFETEVAKCSVCGAWVPIDVKNCPDCGTEFTVGTEDLDDYESKMKRQFEDIVRKFREQAKQDLGKEFTETEFQAWWAKQPTFITFDLWLKEEEEMKRMGSRPCPICETENSVTAKICHKCGSVMGEPEAPAPKKPEGKLPPKQEQPPVKQQPAPTTAAPQKQPPVQPAPAQQPPVQQQAAAPQPVAQAPAQ